jgi:hypothetical protein
VIVDVDHFHVKRIELVSLPYIVTEDAIELLHLVNRLTVEDEWLEPLTIGPLLTMMVL